LAKEDVKIDGNPQPMTQLNGHFGLQSCTICTASPPSRIPRFAVTMSLERLIRRWWPLSLNSILVVPFVLQIVGAVSLTGWLASRSSRYAVREAINELTIQVNDKIESHIDYYLKMPHLILQANGIAITTNILDPQDLTALEQHFFSQLQFYTAVDYLFFGRADGQFVGVQNLPGGMVSKIRDARTAPLRVVYQLDREGQHVRQESSSPYTPLDRPWYLAAVQRGRPTWSPIFTSAHLGVLQIAPAIPLYNDEDKLLGVLASTLQLSNISKFLDALTIGKTGFAVIIEPSGDLVAISTGESVADSAGERISFTDSGNPAIAGVAQQLKAEFGSFDRITQATSVVYRLNGDAMHVRATPFRDGRGLDWTIITIVPESDFMAEINASRQTTILLCAVAAIGAIGFGVLVVRWVTTPVRQLSQIAEKLAQGEWTSSQIPAARSREVTRLATSFTHMSRQLQISFRTLEQRNVEMSNLNAELQRLDRLKDEFLANTSHELRTPLNGTIGIAESMLDGAAGDLTPPQRQNLDLIVRSSYRLATLVNDLLDFSKLRYNQIQLQQQPVGIREAVEVVFAFCAPQRHQKSIELIDAISPDIPLVYADENRLQQILYNLIGNAIKFTDQGFIGVTAAILPSTIAVMPLAEDASVSQPIRQLAITVIDTGIGITPEQQTRIFDYFEQADGSTAREYGGTGLGLTLAKEFIELHGGTLSVTSEPGFGSQFCFTLPIAEAATIATAAAPATPLAITDTLTDFERAIGLDDSPRSPSSPSSSNHHPIAAAARFHILVVDDEPINQQVLLNHLSVEGYRITTAADGREAIAAIDADDPPDLVLLDVMMPKLTGYEVCKILRETYTATQLPIVLITAKNQVEDIVEGLSVGANDYLTKPIRKKELIARINTHLNLSKIGSAYGRFVPREFLRFLQKDSIVDVELGDSVEHEMTILFADIRGFTRLSEGMTPAENFRFINDYLSQMEPVIAEYDGFIDKYIGDAIMALFPHSADDGLQAAIAMLGRLAVYNEVRSQQSLEPIAIGIGINTGSLMLGTVGGTLRMDSTVVGDTVNLTSRLEGLTKVYGTPLLVTHNVVAHLQDPAVYCLRTIDHVTMRGRSEAVAIFEVFDGDSSELRSQKYEMKPIFEQAVFDFYQANFEAAQTGFDQCLATAPGDRAAQIYRDRCRLQLA
jgi:two-component system sensor histidine kinase ChiS